MSETVSGVLKKENVAIKYAKIFQDNSLHDYTCNFLGLTHLIIPGMTVSCYKTKEETVFAWLG